jgi:hypothetical protein
MRKEVMVEVVTASGEMQSVTTFIETDATLPIIEVDLSEYDDTQSAFDIFIKS